MTFEAVAFVTPYLVRLTASSLTLPLALLHCPCIRNAPHSPLITSSLAALLIHSDSILPQLTPSSLLHTSPISLSAMRGFFALVAAMLFPNEHELVRRLAVLSESSAPCAPPERDVEKELLEQRGSGATASRCARCCHPAHHDEAAAFGPWRPAHGVLSHSSDVQAQQAVAQDEAV